jgi:hypothetical protein
MLIVGSYWFPAAVPYFGVPFSERGRLNLPFLQLPSARYGKAQGTQDQYHRSQLTSVMPCLVHRYLATEESAKVKKQFRGWHVMLSYLQISPISYTFLQHISSLPVPLRAAHKMKLSSKMEIDCTKNVHILSAKLLMQLLYPSHLLYFCSKVSLSNQFIWLYTISHLAYLKPWALTA